MMSSESSEGNVADEPTARHQEVEDSDELDKEVGGEGPSQE
jgi:hypothetical protein